MEKLIISENIVKNVLESILNEETSKVRREEYNKVQFRIEELENSLSETLKEFRKLQDSLPDGLKTVANGRISSISSNLNDANKLIDELKVKIRKHKKSSYIQQVDEKKK
jgi:hypothetical protein